MLLGFDLTHLLTAYGGWAVLVFVAIESMGIPIPGETMLLVAAAYAGATGHVPIVVVIAAAAAGAILGDNLGFLIGRIGGLRLLRRYGRYVYLNERKLKVGRYLFQRHGGKAVFFGRFVAVLRVFAAFLAGANRMPWRRFVLFNAAGGLIWAILMGLLGYALGASVQGPLGIATLALAASVVVGGIIVLQRNGKRLERAAEQAIPGALDADRGSAEDVETAA